MNNQKKAYLLAFTAIFLWSTVAVPFKKGLEYFHFIHFLFITILIAVIVSFISLLISKRLYLLKQLSKKQWILSIAAGFLNPFLYYLMLFKAYSLLPAQIAQALNYTWPVILVLLSALFLGQKLNFKNVISLLIGFAGVYLIASQGNPLNIQPAEPLGVILAVSTSIVWASFWIINTKLKTDSFVNLFINFSTGLLLTLPLIFFYPFNYSVSFTGWISVIYSGIFEMGITFVIWLSAMKLTYRTDKISNFVFFAPFLSLIFIHIFLHEQIYYTTFAGLLLIVVSIFLNRYFSKNSI